LISNEQDTPKKNKDHKAMKVVETSSDEDTAMFIKTFKKFVRKKVKFQRKGKKRACYECGQTGHFIADCPNKKEQEAKKEYKKEKFKKGGKTKGYFKKKKYGQAHIGEEWNSDEESSSSEEEEVVANVAIQSTSSSQLFTNLQDDSYTPTCLMAKGDKVTLFSNDFPNDDDDDEQIAMKNKMIKEFGLNGYNCRCFETGGSLGPTSECRRVPQPRWVEREGEREGGRARRPETGVREVGILRPSCSSRAQVRCACSRGLQASTRVREQAASKRAPVSSSSPRGQPSLRGPWSFLL
jgi:hypothetical protein